MTSVYLSVTELTLVKMFEWARNFDKSELHSIIDGH